MPLHANNGLNEEPVPSIESLNLVLLDLPDDVLALAVSCGLHSPADAAAAASTCRRLRSVCKQAPFHLSLPKIFSLNDASPSEAQQHLHVLLAALCQSFPGTVELDLSSLPLGNDSVELVQSHLPALASLKLSGCKKLTRSAVQSVATAEALRSIDLQRCFQLCAESFTELLEASSRPHSKLSTLAMSHLDLSTWSLPSSCSSSFSSSPSWLSLPPKINSAAHPGSLRMLALHNGAKLTAAGLRSITEACPLLEILGLGGSTLTLVNEDWGTAAGIVPGGGTSPPSHGPITTICPAQLPVALAAVGLESRIDPSNIESGPSSPVSPSTVTATTATAATSVPIIPYQQTDPLALQIMLAAGNCGVNPILLASGHGTWLRSTAAALASAACRLPHLRVLELTFCGFGLATLIPRMLEAAVEGGGPEMDPRVVQARDRVHVWDMCTTDSVQAALYWKSSVIHHPYSSPSDVDMIVSAMARCSSPGRVTALHSAAEDGDVNLLTGLLTLGAEVDARDRGGASALFCACEAGHAGAVARLLAAGASVTLRNAAGEAPLYIAALRGHDRVVDILLRHCSTTGVKWQDPRLYGDGWSPLHAAAVGGRPGIAAQLLAAAGPDAGALVTACNRYGQTCVHVAARKGSPALVQMLVEVGGDASLSAADCDGRTPADVARRNGNSGAWKLLTSGGISARTRQNMQRATMPTIEKPKVSPVQQGGRWVGRRLQQRKSSAQTQQ